MIFQASISDLDIGSSVSTYRICDQGVVVGFAAPAHLYPVTITDNISWTDPETGDVAHNDVIFDDVVLTAYEDPIPKVC